MSIETQLEELNQIKTNIFNSISNKGIIVPENSGLKDAAGLIDKIEGSGILKDSVKMNGVTYKLFFFAGLVFSENLKYPVDVGVNTFAPNGDDNNIEEYGYLYTRAARNALAANINNLGADWGKWAILSCNGQIKLFSDALDKYTLNEKIEKFRPQFAGLRRSGKYLGFGSSFCLGYGDTDTNYCDVTRSNFSSGLSSPGGDALSVRMVLLMD